MRSTCATASCRCGALDDYPHFCGLATHTEPVRVPTIDATALKQLLDAGLPFELVDVREPNEWELVRIPGARLMPKQQLLADGLAKLERTRRTVVYCKGGTRSRDVVQAMCQAGFTDVSNLDGGILSWIRTVDPSLPQY